MISEVGRFHKPRTEPGTSLSTTPMHNPHFFVNDCFAGVFAMIKKKKRFGVAVPDLVTGQVSPRFLAFCDMSRVLQFN